MPMVEWNIGYLLGIEEIDKHHKHLVDLLNLTYQEYRRGAPAESLRQTVDELVDYANYHFSCEERWMSETSYPDLLSHKGEHDIFTSRIKELHDDYDVNANMALDLLSFLSNWFAYHILGTDMKFGQYVEEHKVRRRIISMSLS